jgi:hypothetical protein
MDEKSYLQASMENFRSILVPNGILHIDYSQEKEYSINTAHISSVRYVNMLNTSIRTDRDKRRLRFERDQDIADLEGFNTTKEYLTDLLQRNEFSILSEEKLEGDIFTSIFARKN